MGKLKQVLNEEYEQLVLAYEEGLLSEAEFDRLSKNHLREVFTNAL